MVLHGDGPEEHRSLVDLLVKQHGRHVGKIVVGVKLSGDLAVHVSPVIRSSGCLRIYRGKVAGKIHLLKAQCRIEVRAVVDAVVEGVEIGRVVARVREYLRQAGICEELFLLPAVDHVVPAEEAGVDARHYLQLYVLRAVAERVRVELTGHALGAYAVEVRDRVLGVAHAGQLRHVEEGLAQDEDDARRHVLFRVGQVLYPALGVHEHQLFLIGLGDQILIPSEDNGTPQAEQHAAAAVIGDLRLLCGGPSRPERGVKPGVGRGRHAEKRRKQYCRDEPGYEPRTQLRPEDARDEEKSHKQKQHDGHSRPALKRELHGRLVELHYAAHLGDEAYVLDIQRRGGYEHLVVVGEAEPRHRERDDKPACKGAPAEEA